MKQYPVAFRERALAALDRGTPAAQVARLLGLSPRTLARWRARAAAGSAAPAPRTGRPPRIPPDDAPTLRTQVAARPDATLAEHAAAWTAATGVAVSGRTLGRALDRLGITRKQRRWSPASATRRRGPRGGRRSSQRSTQPRRSSSTRPAPLRP